MTDCEKTLEILKEVGSNGIHSFDLNQRVGTIRCAARINDLKEAGYSIGSQREKLGSAWGVRYFLNSHILTDKQKLKTQMIFDETRNVYVEKFVSC